MNFLYKFYFFDPAKTPVKRELYISSSSIDFFTLYKHEGITTEGTRLQTNIIIKKEDKTEFIAHIVDCVPELCNQMAFDGLFFKSTVQYVAADGGTKKYTSYINPNNICCIYSFQPDSTECFFFSGQRLILSNKHNSVMAALKEHQTKYKARRAEKYEKRQNQKTGF